MSLMIDIQLVDIEDQAESLTEQELFDIKKLNSVPEFIKYCKEYLIYKNLSDNQQTKYKKMNNSEDELKILNSNQEKIQYEYSKFALIKILEWLEKQEEAQKILISKFCQNKFKWSNEIRNEVFNMSALKDYIQMLIILFTSKENLNSHDLYSFIVFNQSAIIYSFIVKYLLYDNMEFFPTEFVNPLQDCDQGDRQSAIQQFNNDIAQNIDHTKLKNQQKEEDIYFIKKARQMKQVLNDHKNQKCVDIKFEDYKASFIQYFIFRKIKSLFQEVQNSDKIKRIKSNNKSKEYVSFNSSKHGVDIFLLIFFIVTGGCIFGIYYHMIFFYDKTFQNDEPYKWFIIIFFIVSPFYIIAIIHCIQFVRKGLRPITYECDDQHQEYNTSILSKLTIDNQNMNSKYDPILCLRPKRKFYQLFNFNCITQLTLSTKPLKDEEKYESDWYQKLSGVLSKEQKIQDYLIIFVLDPKQLLKEVDDSNFDVAEAIIEHQENSKYMCLGLSPKLELSYQIKDYSEVLFFAKSQKCCCFQCKLYFKYFLALLVIILGQYWMVYLYIFGRKCYKITLIRNFKLKN